MTGSHKRKYRDHLFFLGGGVGGGIVKVLKLAVPKTMFRNTHWLEKSLTTMDYKPWKLFVKLAKMPVNNCFQKVLIKNLCGSMSSESWQKVQKGISDSDKL